MRESGLVSMTPYLEKSTTGMADTCKPPPEPPCGCASVALTKLCTSFLVMRPFSPLPLTRVRSTPNSRAKCRMDGLACAFPVGLLGKLVGATIGVATGAVTGVVAAGFAASFTGAGVVGGLTSADVSVALVSIDKISVPSDILSPTLTLTFFTTPSNGAGTSIVALSVSKVSRDCSALTVSPAFTITSITGTSLESPMSGISTCLISATRVSCPLRP